MTAVVDEEALEWAVRARDPDFDDWDGLTAWLEFDPAHMDRYEEISATLAAARDVAATIPPRTMPEPANDRSEPRRGWLRWSGGAIAAVLVGVVGLSMWNDRAQPYSIETPAGQQQVVALADGSRAIMAGGSKLGLDRSEQRFASVERGEVLFEVRHDAADPFRMRAGDLSITDLGTVFDVKLGQRHTRVAVSEGAVMVDPDGAKVRLLPGQAVISTGRELKRQPAEDVGGWRKGRLLFDDTTLAEVANDLSRHIGHPVHADADVADRSFRGTIDIETIRNDPTSLGRLLGVAVRVDGRAWILERGR